MPRVRATPAGRDFHLRLHTVRDDRVLGPAVRLGDQQRVVWRVQVDPGLVQTRGGAPVGWSERGQRRAHTIGLAVESRRKWSTRFGSGCTKRHRQEGGRWSGEGVR